MSPAFPFGQSVVLHSRTVTGQDAYGNDVYTSTDTPLTNVPVWPRNASELVQGQDTLITGLWCVLPASVDVFAVDTLTVYDKTYKVDGEPGDFRASPLTGNGIGWQVALTRVS